MWGNRGNRDSTDMASVLQGSSFVGGDQRNSICHSRPSLVSSRAMKHCGSLEEGVSPCSQGGGVSPGRLPESSPLTLRRWGSVVMKVIAIQ